LPEQGGAFLVLRKTESAGCDFEIGIADVGTGRYRAAADAPVQCVAETGAAAFLRPDTIRRGRVVMSSDSAGGARRLLVATIPGASRQRAGPSEPLAPWIDEKQDALDRFDPVWVDDSRVLYVRK
jgi:hypothetical protein